MGLWYLYLPSLAVLMKGVVNHSMRALFLLVSQQQVPNILPVLTSEVRPDLVIGLVSNRFEQEWQYLADTMEQRNVRTEEVRLPDAAVFDYEATDAIASERMHELVHAGYEVWANVTGGTKPMSLGLYMAATNQNGAILYVEGDQLLWLQTPPGNWSKTLRLSPYLSPELHLALFGTVITDFDESGIKPSVHTFLDTMVNELPKLESELGRANKQLNEQQHYPKKGCHKALRRLYQTASSCGLMRDTGGSWELVDDQARLLLTGAWLEWYALKCVREVLRATEVDTKVYRSVKITRTRDDREVPNELDVVIALGHSLYVIECKCARPNSLEPAFAKAAELRQNIAGQRTKYALLSAFAGSEMLRQRADLSHGMTLWELTRITDLREQIARWLGVTWPTGQ